jgi:hypothetical protein
MHIAGDGILVREAQRTCGRATGDTARAESGGGGQVYRRKQWGRDGERIGSIMDGTRPPSAEVTRAGVGSAWMMVLPVGAASDSCFGRPASLCREEGTPLSRKGAGKTCRVFSEAEDPATAPSREAPSHASGVAMLVGSLRRTKKLRDGSLGLDCSISRGLAAIGRSQGQF